MLDFNTEAQNHRDSQRIMDNELTYHSIYESQVLTYLRLTGLGLGLVINFGKDYVKNGICRVVNEY